MFHPTPKERIPGEVQSTDKREEKDRLDIVSGWYKGKAGVFYTAVILEQGVEILKKYHFKLPIIGNHKLNVYLKTIRDICGIDKPIFSHVARHTYATRCLNRGIRLEVVAKLLGHSTTRITQHYAKLLQNNILNEVKDAFEKSY